VQLLPEEEDDLWHAYNLIAVGDTLQAVTVRWVFGIPFAWRSFRFSVQFTRSGLVAEASGDVQECL
jgi:hypothetical protein